MLNVLEVSYHAGVFINRHECLRLLKLSEYHHLIGFLFELHISIVVGLALQSLLNGLIRCGNHQLALVVRMREHTLGHTTAVCITVEEELFLGG